MPKHVPIRPLFTTINQVNHIGQITLSFTVDNYNKKNGATLIDAKTDPEAITAFLNEYKESPATIKLYAKEIERLLLWCIHIAKVNISSIKRDHLLEYQKFLKSPSPKSLWCGPCVSRLNKDGTLNSKWRPFVAGLSGSSIN